jgi:hypothetical protein
MIARIINLLGVEKEKNREKLDNLKYYGGSCATTRAVLGDRHPAGSGHSDDGNLPHNF